MPFIRTAKRGLITSIVFSLVVLFLLTSCRASDTVPSREGVISLNRWLDSQRQLPAEQILNFLNEEESAGSPVFVQENPIQADFIRMVTAIYPALYEAGLNEIAVFFLENADQTRLDELVGFSGTDTSSHSELADRFAGLVFESNPLYGYREYVDFLLSVRRFNSVLPDGEKPLRVLGFPGQQAAEEGENDELNKPADSSGINRFYWVSTETLRRGNTLNSENSFFITLHTPLEKTWRWNSLIETVSEQRNLRDRTYAFKSSEAPFSGWDNDAPDYPVDLYIVTAFDFQSATPIESFVTAERVDDRLTRMRLKTAIRKASRVYERRLTRLQRRWKSSQ